MWIAGHLLGFILQFGFAEGSSNGGRGSGERLTSRDWYNQWRWFCRTFNNNNNNNSNNFITNNRSQKEHSSDESHKNCHPKDTEGGGKGKATSTKENAKLRGKEISNRFTLPDTVPADVRDPSDLVAMADSNDFNVRVRDRMPSHREIVQLSQEQGVHYNVAFAQEQEKAKVAEHALTDMTGSFPSLPPSDMLETATITAVVDDAAPTPMESPPTAAPSFASKVSSSNTSFRGKATLSANIEGLKYFSIDTLARIAVPSMLRHGTG